LANGFHQGRKQEVNETSLALGDEDYEVNSKGEKT
jgi:hypothetical protein